MRAQQAAREQRDAEVDKLRSKYQKTLDRLEERLSKEQQELAEDRAHYEGRKREELLSGAETVVGMLGTSLAEDHPEAFPPPPVSAG